MAAMDLRTNQEMMGVQSRYSTEYGSHMLKVEETYEEDDFKGNNNLYNSLKTDANSNHGHDPSSLFQVNSPNKKNLEVDNSLFSYSSFKKAMDLRTHNRTLDGGKRTIFDDAEHFAKNYCYKLLPITFEQVDETIIQSEHNYSLFSVTAESEPEEDCSRMMDYSQIKEKNYKRRRTKFREGSDEEETTETAGDGGEIEDRSRPLPEQESVFADCRNVSPEPENPAAVQPLDLSAAPAPEFEKTDLCLRERPNGSPEKNDREKMVQLDSDKENANAEPNGIRVTITRPDEKENYQPCDLFLNDIARLVPWLIDKDCLEVDILDRTCDRHDELRKHRLYYVIAESTWRLFQGTNERVILTNDQSLGQPLPKAEKDEKPSYLVFDQFSLAKCLAEHCQEIGGCFEYTCVEEGREGKEADGEALKKSEVVNKIGEIETEEEVQIMKEETMAITQETEEKAGKELCENLDEEIKKAVEELKEEIEEVERPKEEEEKVPEKPKEKIKAEVVKTEKENRVSLGKTQKKKTATTTQTKPSTKPPIQPIPKNDRMTTRSKSTSESETSQKSDKRVSTGDKRQASALPGEEPPNKMKKQAPPEPACRITRSSKILNEVGKKKGRPKKAPRGKEADMRVTRNLRSQRGTQKKGTNVRKTGTSSKLQDRRR